jgi:hypothetical protein
MDLLAYDNDAPEAKIKQELGGIIAHGEGCSPSS